jgi:hypothetical protein
MLKSMWPQASLISTWSSQDIVAQLFAEHIERFHIQPDAFHLHVGQHAHQGHFHAPEELSRDRPPSTWGEGLVQLPSDVRILGGIVGHLLHRHIAHALLAFAFGADQLVMLTGR